MKAKCWSLTAHFCKAVIVIFRQTWDSNLLLAKEIRVFLQFFYKTEKCLMSFIQEVSA